MSNVKIELDFPHQYQVEVLASPGARKPVRIPDAGEEVDSLLLKISPDGEDPWLGSFARGFSSNEMLSGVYAWPDGVSVSVIASGYGYVLKANDPTSWVRLQPMPITAVRLMPELKLIVFADFTNLYAYNAEKNVWKTGRLSWDGVTITQVSTHHIFGLGWDAMADKEMEFVVDARTGEHTGGAPPWAKR